MHRRGVSATATAGVVLAAGGSRRFATGHKGLAPIDGVPAVRHVTETLRSAGVARIAVVVGADGERVAAAVADDVAVIPNDRWEEGRTGSVQLGLAWAGSAPSTLVAPVDHPFFRASTVAALLEALDRDPMAVWVQPVYGRRGGHPVVLRRAAYDAVARLGPNAPLRQVAHDLAVGVLRVPVDDEGVLLGTDSVIEYERSLATYRASRSGAEHGP